MENETCPVCGRQRKDLLLHVRLQHNITDLDQLKFISEEYEKRNQKASEFRTYITDLNSKLKRKEITIAEFKKLRDFWFEQNR